MKIKQTEISHQAWIGLKMKAGTSVEPRELAYKKHEATNKYYVRVRDAETKEIVREVPAPEDLDRIARLVRYLQANFGI